MSFNFVKKLTKNVMDDVGSAAKSTKEAVQKYGGGASKLAKRAMGEEATTPWADVVANHPWKTAGIGVGTVGLASLLSGGDEGMQVPEGMEDIVESLRNQGLSDEEIQQYIDYITSMR